jgi:RimJ/RimL family protein N-acetyltransferase
MKIVKYGIVLQRITEEDIEMVRNWRNSIHVVQNMQFKKYITPEMQMAWFRSIDNLDNYFYIIIANNEKIGIISEKRIDFEEDGTTESGLFMSDPKHYNTFIPVLASLIMVEGSFYLKNGQDSYIRILKNNLKAIEYNTSLGYTLMPGQEDEENQLYILTKEQFEKHGARLRKAARLLSGDEGKTRLILEPHDYLNGVGQFWDDFIRTEKIPATLEIEGINRVYTHYY